MFEMAFLQRKEFRYAYRPCRAAAIDFFLILSPITCSHAIIGSPCRVLHEPLGEAYYYGPERMSKRFTAESRPEEFKKYADLTSMKVRPRITCVASPSTADRLV